MSDIIVGMAMGTIVGYAGVAIKSVFEFWAGFEEVKEDD